MLNKANGLRKSRFIPLSLPSKLSTKFIGIYCKTTVNDGPLSYSIDRKDQILLSYGRRSFTDGGLWMAPSTDGKLSKDGAHDPFQNPYIRTLRKRSPRIDSLPMFSPMSLRFADVLDKYSTLRHMSTLSIDKESMGDLATSSVVCRQGNTVVHAVVASEVKYDSTDGLFLPLTVEYRARAYAQGQLPMTKTKRERHGDQDEILCARVIDRSIRPLFAKGYVDNIQVTATLHCNDGINDPVTTAINAASLALTKSKLPWNGPIGCVRVGFINGEIKVNPSIEEMKSSSLDLLYSGTFERCMMIEVAANELAEDIIMKAMEAAQDAVVTVIAKELQLLDTNKENNPPQSSDGGSNEATDEAKAVVIQSATTQTDIPRHIIHIVPTWLSDYLNNNHYSAALDMFRNSRHLPRKARSKLEGRMYYQLSQSVKTYIANNPPETTVHPPVIQLAVHDLIENAFRQSTVETLFQNEKQELSGRRVDGRKVDEIRSISMSVGHLPVNVHGSSIFKRGDTHVLSTATIGSLDECIEELTPVASISLEGTVNAVDDTPLKFDNFFLHYDFPAYATGELGSSTNTNRRMVGHGNLAEKALQPLIPPIMDFPYAIRVFCECTSSNGSSSMASVCAGTLALLDAGVPLKSPAAGISIGLMTYNDGILKDDKSKAKSQYESYLLLTDIIGQEDHFGDMDFKIAGTRRGVTAMQLDCKLSQGIPLQVLAQAIERARIGRYQILDEMQPYIPRSKPTLKQLTPKAELIAFNSDRKRFLVGPSGEMIKYIQNMYNVVLTVFDSQSRQSRNLTDLSDSSNEVSYAYIIGQNRQNVFDAKCFVEDVVLIVEEGQVLTAEILEVKDFGLIVKLTRAQEALLHVSELSWDPAVSRGDLSQIFCTGQRIDVKVVAADKATGLVKVSRKVLADKNSTVPDQYILSQPFHIKTTGAIDEPPVDNTADLLQDNPDGKSQDNVIKGNTGAGSKLQSIGSLPSFPVIPPRKFNAEYFRFNVASQEDVERALRKMKGEQTMTPTTSSASTTNDSRKPNYTNRTKHGHLNQKFHDGAHNQNHHHNSQRGHDNHSKGQTHRTHSKDNSGSTKYKTRNSNNTDNRDSLANVSEGSIAAEITSSEATGTDSAQLGTK